MHITPTDQAQTPREHAGSARGALVPRFATPSWRPARVAVIHDWLSLAYGRERVVEHILRCFPEADLYTLFDFLPDNQRGFLAERKIYTSFLQRLPFVRRRYQLYLPLMPLALEQFDLSRYQLIISSHHSFAKGVLSGPNQLHVTYVHAPAPYAWDGQHAYLRLKGYDRGLSGLLTRYVLHHFRMWDMRTSHPVDLYLTNSHFSARRVAKLYGRDARVVHPGVPLERMPLTPEKNGAYLAVSRFAPHKRTELLLEAFAHMPERKLVLISDGGVPKRLRHKVPANVEVIGYQEDDAFIALLAGAKALISAAEEDFGTILIEAQACGTPVIAFGSGGALETVRPLEQDDPTGVFFDEQSGEAIVDAVIRFERFHDRIDPQSCRRNAERFTPERFQQEFLSTVHQAWERHRQTISGDVGRDQTLATA
ncbi:MAG: glycosyltransferase [Geminicoccaceae bacterium]